MAKPERKGKKTKKAPKLSWQAKELQDINRYWKPAWNSKEGKRKAALRKS
jgi:hypothetical protein